MVCVGGVESVGGGGGLTEKIPTLSFFDYPLFTSVLWTNRNWRKCLKQSEGSSISSSRMCKKTDAESDSGRNPYCERFKTCCGRIPIVSSLSACVMIAAFTMLSVCVELGLKKLDDAFKIVSMCNSSIISLTEAKFEKIN